MATPPAFTSPLIGWYVAESYDDGAALWRDLSGSSNHAAVSGRPTVLSGTAGSVDFCNGRPHLRGTTAVSVTFPSAILPLQYTLFHVTRSWGASLRIFTSSNDNWLSGFCECRAALYRKNIAHRVLHAFMWGWAEQSHS